MRKCWVKTEVFLGMDKRNGGKVSEGDFGRFVADVVTKSFPKGLTLYEAYGQMQHASGKIEKQPTRVIVIVCEKSAANLAAVEQLVRAYRARFDNPQAMVLISPTTPTFYSD